MTKRPVLIAAVLFFGLAAVGPSRAQFGSIFGDAPPRPPADVPGRGPTRLQPADEPPTQPLPAPMNLPPSQRPGAAIQSQPLAPPPGSSAAPAAPLRGTQGATQSPALSPNTAAPDLTTTAPMGSAPIQTLPGLPPGQRQPRGTPQQDQQPAQQQQVPTDEIVVAPPEQKIENPTAVFSGLDKITGRTISFDVAINETVQFGALQVTPHVCYSRPPTETPRTDSFVTVDEVTLQGEVRRIFNGWMFASSPGLNAVEHPIYDVWLTGCKGGASTVADTGPDTKPDTKPEAKPAPAARTKPAPARRTTTIRPPNIPVR